MKKIVDKVVARLTARVAGFVADLRGVSTVEYALIVVAVIAVVGAAGAVLSGAFGSLFTTLSTELMATATAL